MIALIHLKSLKTTANNVIVYAIVMCKKFCKQNTIVIKKNLRFKRKACFKKNKTKIERIYVNIGKLILYSTAFKKFFQKLPF